MPVRLCALILAFDPKTTRSNVPHIAAAVLISSLQGIGGLVAAVPMTAEKQLTLF